MADILTGLSVNEKFPVYREDTVYPDKRIRVSVKTLQRWHRTQDEYDKMQREMSELYADQTG